MTKIDRVKSVFRKVFGESTTVGLDTTKKDIPKWDSINHLSLILELEEEFNVSFSIEQMEKMNSVDCILKTLNP